MTRQTCDNITDHSKPRIMPIDQFRFFAFLGILFVHFVADWKHKFGENSLPDTIAALSFIGRFAVPFFFVTSGYFLKTSTGSALYYAKRLLIPFFVWALLYIAQDYALRGNILLSDMTTQDYYLRLLLNGGTGYHLWFLSSLFFCVMLTLAMKRFLSAKTIIAIAALFFVVGLAFKPYGLALWGVEDILNFDTRNGPFFGLIFLTIGSFAKPFLEKSSLRTGALMLIAGLALQYGEARFLETCYHSPFYKHDFLVGTLLMGVGAFVVALHMPWKNTVCASLGHISLGLYAAHLFFLTIALSTIHQPTWTNGCYVILFTLSGSIILSLTLKRWKTTRILVA